jgi:hypothetical protein
LKHERIVVLAENAVKSRSLRINGFREVLPAAKGPALAREEHGAHFGVAVGFSEGLLQFQGHPAVKSVKYFGSVQRDPKHGSVSVKG